MKNQDPVFDQPGSHGSCHDWGFSCHFSSDGSCWIVVALWPLPKSKLQTASSSCSLSVVGPSSTTTACGSPSFAVTTTWMGRLLSTSSTTRTSNSAWPDLYSNSSHFLRSLESHFWNQFSLDLLERFACFPSRNFSGSCNYEVVGSI